MHNNTYLTKLCLTIFIQYVVIMAGLGQNFDELSIPFTNGERDLYLNEIGGLRSPQFSNIDFNNDGIQDLFIFDKHNDKITPLVKTGVKGSLTYRYAPEYINQFPKLKSWVLLVDYNRDGLKDIFTSSTAVPNCIELWIASQNTNGLLTYKRLTFNHKNFYSNILAYKVSNFYVQVYSTAYDIPAILDVDDDGDIDILSFDTGGGQVFFYKNLSVEENMSKDSVKYHLQETCWGRFVEDQTNDVIKLGLDTLGCGNNFAPPNDGTRHIGSSTLILDIDGDGLKDILIGDVSSNFVKKLTNGGSKTKAFMTKVEDHFPANDPIDIYDFVAIYNVDIDGDNIKDLIAAPNNKSNAQNKDFIWVYKNVGTNQIPNYNLITKNFLVEDMPFFYGSSHPAFVDINADGLQDLVIGSIGEVNNKGKFTKKMVLALNKGSETKPSYELVDEDYLQFSMDTIETGRLAPSFGDLDNDGDQDLLVGDSGGKVYFFENIAGKGRPASWGKGIYNYHNFSEGQNAKPFIYDLDRDGLQDIIMGKKNNELIFYKNIGSQGNPKFDPNKNNLPNDTQLGNILNNSDASTYNASPFIIQTTNQKLLLLFGTDDGGIKTYDHVENNIYNDFNLVYGQTGSIKTGQKMTISLADIDGDEYYEMAVGNETGGINFYNTIFKVDTTSDIPTLLDDSMPMIAPNPANDQVHIYAESMPRSVTLLNMYGHYIQTLNIGPNQLKDVPSGVYLIKFDTSNGNVVQKLVIQK